MTNFTQALTERIAHDLIGPLGTAQMAINSDENEMALRCIEQTITKMEIFRNISKIIQDQSAQDSIRKYIMQNNLNCEIKKSNDLAWEPEINALIFFLVQKMLKKSILKISKNSITLSDMFLREEEIESLEGRTQNVNYSNVLPYFAYTRFQEKYTISVIKQENNNWKIDICEKQKNL